MISKFTLHLSSRGYVGRIRSPESLTYVSSSGSLVCRLPATRNPSGNTLHLSSRGYVGRTLQYLEIYWGQDLNPAPESVIIRASDAIGHAHALAGVVDISLYDVSRYVTLLRSHNDNRHEVYHQTVSGNYDKESIRAIALY